MREHPLDGIRERQSERREWVCRKCGQLRSNKETHIHGRALNEPKAV